MENIENTTSNNINQENIIENINKIQENTQEKKEENNQKIIIKEETKEIENIVDDEKIPLKYDAKLVDILKNFYNKVKKAEDEYTKNEDDYENFFKNENKKHLKQNLSCFYKIFMLTIGGIAVIINLYSIFAIKSVLDTLFTTLIVAIKNFLYKKTYLEKNKLIDFKSRFLSSYNFYERYYDHISSNDIDFDLMMFWDFIGLLLYESYGFKCSSIICLVLSSLFLLLLYTFDFLDIDKSRHIYSVVHIFLLFILYVFLWIPIGSSALLAQHIYFNGLKISLRKEPKDLKNKETEVINISKITDEKQTNQEGNNNNGENNNNLPNQIVSKTESESNLNIKKDNKNENDKNEEILKKFEFPILITTIFISFLINHIINREIYEYKRNYFIKTLHNNNNEDAFIKIYSKEKKIFLLCVCIPYSGGIILSIILISFFNCIFINIKDDKKENKNEIKDELKIKENNSKKLCGYLIFKQTIEGRIREEIKNVDSKIKCNNYFCKTLYLLIKTIIDIFSSCCSKCKCQCCCNYNKYSYDSKEITFCLCYQKKGILRWIFDSIDNESHQMIIIFAFFNFYCQLFTLGYEAKIDEINKEKNEEQFNIIVPLIIICLAFVIISIIISNKNLSNFSIFGDKFDIKELSSYFFAEALITDVVISIISFGSSIHYLSKSITLLKKTDKYFLYFLIIINKFLIFTLSYICTKLDDENELISKTTFTSIYLYLFDLILYGIKKIASIKALLIIQISSSSIYIILSIIIIIILINKYK